MRAVLRVGHALAEIEDEAVELRRRGCIDGLVQVVGGSVIPVLQPLLGDLLLWRAFFVSELEGQRGHALPDEAVLIAPDEQVPVGLLIGLHGHTGFLAGGTDVSVSTIEYLSTKLTNAKFAALRLAVADARKRATTIAQGLDARLGPVQKTTLGVYQITPRNSTEVSDYGIDDVTSRLKDVEAVVTVTFRVEH